MNEIAQIGKVSREDAVGRMIDVRGRDLVGELSGAASDRQVVVYVENELIGSAQLANTASDDGSENTRFTFRLPRFLYDGRVHQLKFYLNGKPKSLLKGGVFMFVGDPALAEGKRAAVGQRPKAAPTPAIEAPTATPAIEAPTANALSAVMRALEVQSRALGKMLERMAPEHSAEVEEEFRTLAVRYGPLLEEALLKHGSGPDIIWFGVIDWDFRIQRPQHLAMRLADLGSRVFYVSIVFEAMDKDGRFRIIRSVYPGVFELRLKLAGPLPENIYGGFTPDQIAELRASLDEVLLLLHLRSLRAVVQYPSWLPVITSMPGVGIVHDCLDLISGFSNVPPDMLRLEEKLVEQADAIVVPSQPLAEHVATARSCVVIRNGADVKFFFRRGARRKRSGRRSLTRATPDHRLFWCALALVRD